MYECNDITLCKIANKYGNLITTIPNLSIFVFSCSNTIGIRISSYVCIVVFQIWTMLSWNLLDYEVRTLQLMCHYYTLIIDVKFIHQSCYSHILLIFVTRKLVRTGMSSYCTLLYISITCLYECNFYYKIDRNWFL